MKHGQIFKGFFLVASLYDLILGLGFFFFYDLAGRILGVEFPKSPVYVQATAAFVFVQGVGYWLVFKRMKENADIVRLGVVYKAMYSLLSFYYWGIGILPHPIFGVFGILDVGFLIGFLAFLRFVPRLSAR